MGHLQVLLLCNTTQIVDYSLFREWSEPEQGAPGLDWLYYSPRIITAKDEPTSVSVLLHRSAERVLGVPGHIVSLVENENLERNHTQGSHSSKFLDSRANNVNASLVAGVQLHENVLEAGPEQVMGEAESSRRLPRPWGSGEKTVGHRACLHEFFEPADDFLLVLDLVENLRPVFLCPQSSFHIGVSFSVESLLIEMSVSPT